jgi:transcriptional regulator with XRE-family HTH domain
MGAASKTGPMKLPPKKGPDPVALYVRHRLDGLIGDEPGQMQQQDAAARIGVSPSALSQMRNGVHGINRRRYAAFARLLKIRGSDEAAAESLVNDAGEWYRSLVSGKMPLLEEPAVRAAVDLVARSEGISPKVVESLLSAFGNSRFRGRDTSFWLRTLSEELRFDASMDQASNET